MPKVESVQQDDVARIHGDDFICDVYFPAEWEVKIGEEFSVTFKIHPRLTIAVDRVVVEVYGNIGDHGEWTDWNYTWKDMTMFEDVYYTAIATFNVSSIPSGIGLVCVRITALYQDHFGAHQDLFANFGITKIYTKTYQEIQEDYNSLNQNYQNLQEKNNSLEASLSLFRIIAIVFVITTVIFTFTTIYFARKKPKVKTN